MALIGGTEDRRCPQCGSDVPGLAPGAEVTVVDLRDWTSLTGLLDECVDRVRCPLCDHRFDARPTVALLFSPRKVVLTVIGTSEDGASTTTRSLATEAGDGWLAIECAEIDELRATVWNWAADRAAFVDGFGTVNDRTSLAFLRENFRSLSPELLAPLHAVFDHERRDLIAQGDDHVAVGRYLERLSELQAWSWALLAAQSDRPSDGDSFDDDISRFVTAFTPLPGAVERCLNLLPPYDPATERLSLQRYACEALRVLLRRLLGKDPEDGQWTELWLALETVGLREGATERRIEAVRLSAERSGELLEQPVVLSALERRMAVDARAALELAGHVENRLGLQGIIEELTHLLYFPSDSAPTARDALEYLLNLDTDTNLTLLIASALVSRLAEVSSGDAVWVIADGLAAIAPDDTERRALVQTWAGKTLKEMNLPSAFLRRVGSSAEPWEASLPHELRVYLANERSNALRLTGDARAALGILEELRRLDDEAEPPIDEKNRIVLERNIAILRRERGDREGGLTMQKALVARTSGLQRAQELLPLVTTYLELGRESEAAAAMKEAWRLGRGSIELRSTMRILRARLLADSNRAAAAVQLTEVGPVDRLTPNDLVAFVQLASSILAGEPESDDERDLDENLENIFAEAMDRLESEIETLLHAGSFRTAVVLARVAARIHQDYASPSEFDYLRIVDGLTTIMDGRRSAVACLGLAREAMESGDLADVRALLTDAAEAFRAEFERYEDLNVVVDATRHLETSLRLLADRAIQVDAPSEFLRVIGELSRDMMGRMRSSVQGAFDLPWDDRLVDRPALHDTIVVEWLVANERLLALFTTVSRTGVETRILAPPHRLLPVAERLQTRLQVWHTGRSGDPFDDPDWVSVATWFASSLDAHDTGGRNHVMLVENRSVAGLPWHVEAGIRRDFSYIPSWGHIVAVPDYREPTRTGIVLVPRFAESGTVTKALDQTADFGRALGVPVRILEGIDADHAALTELMESTDLILLACHGMVHAGDSTVNWLIAANGRLPFPSSALSHSDAGSAHRYGWTDCHRLSRAPTTVLSVACSTGVAHYRGGGEQVGLFTALRRNGTQTLVAPRWDVPAAEVLPMMHDVVRRILDGCSVVVAVRQASVKASETMPRWIAWSLAVHGNERMETDVRR